MENEPNELTRLRRMESELEATRPKTGEAYFIDRDLFLKYVETEVNPARVTEGLETVPYGAASHLFDVITAHRYRR